MTENVDDSDIWGDGMRSQTETYLRLCLVLSCFGVMGGRKDRQRGLGGNLPWSLVVVLFWSYPVLSSLPLCLCLSFDLVLASALSNLLI